MDLTWVSYFIAAVVVYYLVLFVMAQRPKAPEASPSEAELFFVLLVPARNEERVIGATLRSLLSLTGADFAVLVVNDGSTDATSDIAHCAAREDERVIVVDRDSAVAGTGKSDVLNEGFRAICQLQADPNSMLSHWDPAQIVVGVIDADGRLCSDVFESVRSHFCYPSVGSVQIGVEIDNARSGLLARLQDMEFVAFSSFVQVARDRLGSSGLGGNGQFSRMSALQSLGDNPWDPRSLTEDLDLGLRLIDSGWQTRFCADTVVGQQGLTRLGPLFRQRTRWIQGHYQCWKHLPRLARSGHARWYTRLDLMTYLLLVVTVTLVFADLVIGVLGTAGVVEVRNRFLDFMTGDEQRITQTLLAVAPITAFLYTYQTRSRHPLKWWEMPAFGTAFTIYSYFWVLATLRAWGRIATGRWSWVKTPRVPV